MYRNRQGELITEEYLSARVEQFLISADEGRILKITSAISRVK